MFFGHVRSFGLIQLSCTWICSDEGLTLETSAFQSLYGGQFTLSTPLINQIIMYNYYFSNRMLPLSSNFAPRREQRNYCFLERDKGE